MKYAFKKSLIVVCTLLALTFSAMGIQPARAETRLPQGSWPAGLTAADRAQISALLGAGAITSGDYFKASNTEAHNAFGASIALDGNTLVVGAHDAGPGTGAAYVFIRSGGVWSQQAYLGSGVSDLGYSVAISGETIVVGARTAGTAYVFTRSGGV